MDKDWFKIDNVGEADTPFLAVFPDRVRGNIRALKEIMPETSRLRPHAKTNKCRQAIALMLEEGISKFKCATIAEAEMLALSGAPDVLLAYQPVGPKINRFINLVTHYPATNFSCLVDNEEIAREIAAGAAKQNIYISVYLDLNVGMNRTGVDPSNAFDLYKLISGMHGIKMAGLHAYDGHITSADFGARRIACRKAFRQVEVLRDEIMKSGFLQPAISAGSTPTLKLYADNPEVECSPGTFIYWDQTYQELYTELPFKPALLVVTRIISKPRSEILCLDLGYKAVSSESNEQHRVHFLNIPDAEIIGQSEEHMLIKTKSSEELKIGDVVYGVPYHVGRTCNLYPSASTICDSRINGEWLHQQGRKINI